MVPRGWTDGRTDKTKLIVAFRNFAHAFKKLLFYHTVYHKRGMRPTLIYWSSANSSKCFLGGGGGTHAKLRKVNISFLMSGCASIRPYGTIWLSLHGF
jgi:hypothetical protein